jgi:hydroxyacylglutathione hydrolase
MILKGLEISAMAVNCYIVGCEETREVAVIDPGGNAPAILKLLEQDNLKAIYIINTHGHIDHIGANRAVKDATGAKILIHKNDAKMLENAVHYSPLREINSHILCIVKQRSRLRPRKDAK